MCHWNASENLLLALETLSSGSPVSSKQTRPRRHEERGFSLYEKVPQGWDYGLSSHTSFPLQSHSFHDISDTNFWSVSLRMESTNHCTPDLKAVVILRYEKGVFLAKPKSNCINIAGVLWKGIRRLGIWGTEMKIHGWRGEEKSFLFSNSNPVLLCFKLSKVLKKLFTKIANKKTKLLIWKYKKMRMFLC